MLFNKAGGRNKGPTAWDTRHKVVLALAFLFLVVGFVTGLAGMVLPFVFWLVGRFSPSASNHLLVSQKRQEKSKNVGVDNEKDPAIRTKRRVIRLRAYSKLLFRDATKYQGFTKGWLRFKEAYPYLGLSRAGEAADEEPAWIGGIRLSSIAAILTAAAFTVMTATGPAPFRLLAGLASIPALMLNFLGVYVAAQCWASVLRRRITADELQWLMPNSDMTVIESASVEPSDVIDRDAIRQMNTIPAWVRSFVMLVFIGGPVFYIWKFSFLGGFTAAIALAVLTVAAAVAWRLVGSYREVVLADWHQQMEDVDSWSGRFEEAGWKGGNPGYLSSEQIPVPPQPDPETGELPPAEPVTFEGAVFSAPVGYSFSEMSKFAHRMSSVVPCESGNAPIIWAEPLPLEDPSTPGAPLPGFSNDGVGFRLMWAPESLGDRPHLRPDDFPDMAVFQKVVISQISEALVRLKAPGWMMPVAAFRVTKPGAPVDVYEYSFGVHGELSPGWFEKNRGVLAQALGVQWLFVGDRPLATARVGKPMPAIYFAEEDPSANSQSDYVNSAAFRIVETVELDAAASKAGLEGMRCTDVALLTKPGKPSVKVSMWSLPERVSYGNVLRKASDIAERINVDWLRVGRRFKTIDGIPVPNTSVLIAYGAAPSQTEFVNEDEKNWVEGLEWTRSFTRSGLFDKFSGDTPVLLDRDVLVIDPKKREFDVITCQFTSMAAATFDAVVKKGDALSAESGNSFLEVRKSDGRADRFEIVASKENPLNSPKMFDEYEDQLIVGPQELPNLKWGLGTDAKLNILWDDFGDADVPHAALFAGTKGGKSTVLQGMLLQLMSNNRPDQFEITIVEPKIGLETWGDLAHVTDVVWMLNPPPEGTPTSVAQHSQTVFLGRLAYLLTNTMTEMRRRNQVFSDIGLELMGQAIGNIIEAWDVAKKNEAEHPELAAQLRVPTRLVVIEEAILGLSKPEKSISPCGAKYHTIVMGLLQDIAVAGRSAGIHLVMVAQEANKSSFPQEVKRQSRKIALKLNDAAAARNAIGMSGPENLPGYGHAYYESQELACWVRARAFFPTTEVVGRLRDEIPKHQSPKTPPPLLEIPELEEAREADPGGGDAFLSSDDFEDIFPG